MEFESSFKIIVKPNMPKTEMKGFDKSKEAYMINLKAIPKKGKANLELIKFFKKKLKKDIRIISGKTSKRKTIKVL